MYIKWIGPSPKDGSGGEAYRTGIYVYVHMCNYIFICVYICMYVCMYVLLYMYICTYVIIYIYAYMYVNYIVHIYVYIWEEAHRICIYICICTYV